MITLLLIAFLISGLIVMLGYSKIAACVMVGAVVACFGYRWFYLNEALQVVISDGLFCIALLPIGWWASKRFSSISAHQPETRN